MQTRASSSPYWDRAAVFQNPTLYLWRTVWKNVALGLEARKLARQRREAVDDALPLVGLPGRQCSWLLMHDSAAENETAVPGGIFGKKLWGNSNERRK